MQVTSVSGALRQVRTNNSKSTKSAKVSFKSGMTPHIARMLDNTDISEVQQFFAKRGIPTYFTDNQVIAGCSQMTAKIFEKLRLPLPNGVFTYDASVNQDLSNTLGVCFNKPVGIGGNIFASQSVGFNRILDSSSIFLDNIANSGIYGKEKSSTHFLRTFIHEFIHAAHMKNVIKKVVNTRDITPLINLQNKNFDKWKSLMQLYASKYSTTDLQEFIAELYTKHIADSLAPDTILPKYNPIAKAHKGLHSKLSEIVQKAWNGETDF